MAARLGVVFFREVMIATPIAVMAQTRHGVCAPWRVDYILARVCTKNNRLPYHQFRNVYRAEIQGFLAARAEGFSEPPCLPMSARVFGGLVDRQINAIGGG